MYGPLLEALEQGHTVVTGNNRLARTLRQTYDRQQQASGALAWPSPAVFSWGAWQRQLWEESRLAGGSARQRVSLSDSAAAFLWQRAIESIEGADSNLPVAQLSRAARRSWAVLVDWQAITAEEWTAGDLSPDQQALLRWSAEFRRLCDEHQVIDPERVVCGLLEDAVQGMFDAAGPLHFAGCDDLPPLRLALLDSLRDRGVAVTLHAAGQAAATVQGRGFDTEYSELLAAAGWARQCFAAEPDAAITVVIPDLSTRADAVRRVFNDVFAPDWRIGGAPGDLPLNLSYGYPLGEAPIVATATQVLAMLDGDCEFDAFSLVLRSPWLRGGRAEATYRAAAEILLRSELRPEFALQEAVYQFRRGGLAPGFADILDTLNGFAGDRDKRGAAEWAHWFTEVLQAVGWPASDELDSDTWQTLNAWNEALSLFAASGRVLGPMGRQAALGALTRLLQERVFQPEGATGGVQVMGILEAAGHTFDKLWLCGMARELWPAGTKPDPFIPLSLQRRLNIPGSSAAANLQYHAELTRRLLAACPEPVVSWPLQQDGELLQVSPLVGDVAPYTAAAEPEPLWNQYQYGSVEPEWLAADPPPCWTGETPVRGGTSVLNKQAVSPLNAFIERRLGAFEIASPAAGIDAMQRGNITHKALELFYRAYPDRRSAAALSADERLQCLREGLEKAVQKIPGIRSEFIRALADREIEIQLARIENFLAIDFEREDFRVVECEELQEVRVGPLTLRLKLDRLDQLPGGGHLVVDYKTGQVNRQSWNPAAPRDVQLPLYATAVVEDIAAIAFAQVATVNVGYDGVGRPDTGVPGVRTPGPKTRVQVRYQQAGTGELIESWEELQRQWIDVLDQLAVDFAAGDFRLDPRNPNSARGQFAVLSRLYDQGVGIWVEDA